MSQKLEEFGREKVTKSWTNADKMCPFVINLVVFESSF